MSDPKPPSRNCAGCNEPNPPHEMIDQRCLRCTHRELIDCRNALSTLAQHDGNAAELSKSAAAMRLALIRCYSWVQCEKCNPEFQPYCDECNAQRAVMDAALQCTAGRDYVPRAELERLHEQNRQLITTNAELATKATEAAEQLLVMTDAEDDARRELVRLRLRLDWLEATQPTPPTPEPSRNTAGLHEPVWDSRNSDEPKTEVL